MFPYLFLLRFSSSLAVSQDAVCPSGSACKTNNSGGFIKNLDNACRWVMMAKEGKNNDTG